MQCHAAQGHGEDQAAQKAVEARCRMHIRPTAPVLVVGKLGREGEGGHQDNQRGGFNVTELLQDVRQHEQARPRPGAQHPFVGEPREEGDQHFDVGPGPAGDGNEAGHYVCPAFPHVVDGAPKTDLVQDGKLERLTVPIKDARMDCRP